MSVTLTLRNNKLLATPSHGLGQELHTLGGRYIKQAGGWEFPPAYAYIEQMGDLYGRRQVILKPDVKAWMRAPDRALDYTALPPRILEAAFPHQLKALQYLGSTRHHGALLAQSPGLGKTFTSIAFAHLMGYKRPLVVAPLSVVPSWGREIQAWAGDAFQLVHGKQPLIANGEDITWTLTNFDSLLPEYTFSRGGRVTSRRYWFEGSFDLLIVDESVLISNKDAHRTQILQELARHAHFVLLLSGVPIRSYYHNLWAQFKAIDPTLFTSYWRFVKYYCYTEDNQWGTQILGSKTHIDVRKHFKDLMLVQNIDEVMILPDYVHHTLECSMGEAQAEMYRKAKEEFLLQLQGEDLPITSILAQLTRLQQIVSHPGNIDPAYQESGKLDALLRFLEGSAVDTPCLIWTHWRWSGEAVTTALQAKGYKAVWIAAGAKDIDKHLESYKTGKYHFLVMSLGVGKYGHTLTNTRTIIYYDLTFDADAYMQSLPRVRRIGLQHPVKVYRLVTPGTVERLVELNLQGKMPGIAQLTNADLSKLLEGV